MVEVSDISVKIDCWDDFIEVLKVGGFNLYLKKDISDHTKKAMLASGDIFDSYFSIEDGTTQLLKVTIPLECAVS